MHEMKNLKYILFLFVITVYIHKLAAADNEKQEVGIDEKTGQMVPLNLSFLDETGQPVVLKDLINKPTILTLVYYRCPGLCSPLLNGVTDMVDKLDMEIGKDYNIVTISFDPREDYMVARDKKKNYLNNLAKKIPESSWRFLTGDTIAIAKLTDAVGFRYKRQGEDYIHGAVITILTPEGKIARYLYGTDFLPLDVKLALTEASEGKTGPAINKLLKFCYSYDPEGRKYVLSVTRIAGSVTLLAIIGFALVLTLKKKKNNTSKTEGNTKNG
jgi:protein SCO1